MCRSYRHELLRFLWSAPSANTARPMPPTRRGSPAQVPSGERRSRARSGATSARERSVRIRRGGLGGDGARHDALLKSGRKSERVRRGRRLFRSRQVMPGYCALRPFKTKSGAPTGQRHRTRRAKIRTSVLPSIGKRSAPHPHLAGRRRRAGRRCGDAAAGNAELRPGVGPLTVSTPSLLFAPDPAIGESRRLTTATVAELIREQRWTRPPAEDPHPSRLEADLPR